jgi:hypothetical protein
VKVPNEIVRGALMTQRPRAARTWPESTFGGIMTKKLDRTEARQGETHQGVRYVLAISLTAAVVALAVVVVVFVV